MQRTQSALLARLARLNPTTVFLVALALVLVGFFAPGLLGGVPLLLLVAGMVALLVTTWPVTSPAARVFRLLMLALLTTAALVKLL